MTDLPKPCEKCAPDGGYYVVTERGAKRCDCARGKALTAAANPVKRRPVLSDAEATIVGEMMATMPYYPPEAGARMAICSELIAMCHSLKDAKWLATRMPRLYPRWPGLQDLRRVYYSRKMPLDGIAPVGISEYYPGGIPSEKPQPESEQKRLPDAVSADPQLDAALRKLAASKSMPQVRTPKEGL